jgi:hypothetical protein
MSGVKKVELNKKRVQLVSYTVVGLVLLGAFLTALPTDQARFYGFSVWVITNLYWLCYNLRKHEMPLVAQFTSSL